MKTRFYNSLAGLNKLRGEGGASDKSIDKKSWTMSAAAMPVISAVHKNKCRQWSAMFYLARGYGFP